MVKNALSFAGNFLFYKMMKKLICAFCIACVTLPSLCAFDHILKLPSREVFIKFGYPDDLLPTRGKTTLEDSVLISYNEGLAFVIWENQVIEIRIDKRYRKDILGLYMGMSSEQIKTIAEGKVVQEKDDKLILTKQSPAGTAQLELFFLQNKLVQICITPVETR